MQIMFLINTTFVLRIINGVLIKAFQENGFNTLFKKKVIELLF